MRTFEKRIALFSGILAFALILLGATFQAKAALIGVAGGENSALATMIDGLGHTSVNFGSSPSTNSGDYLGLTALVLNEAPGNSQVKDFVFGGGLLITSFLNATEWVFDTENLLAGTRSGSSTVGDDTPVTLTAAAVSAGLDVGMTFDSGTTYSEGNNTRVFDFGTFLGDTVFATWSSGNAIVGGEYGQGYIYSFTYRSFGGTNDANHQTLVGNMIKAYALGEPPTIYLILLVLAGLLAFSVYKRTKL